MLGLFHSQIEPKRFRQLFTYPTSVNGPERVKKGRRAFQRAAQLLKYFLKSSTPQILKSQKVLKSQKFSCMPNRT